MEAIETDTMASGRKSFRQIGEELGISASEARAAYRSAMEKLARECAAAGIHEVTPALIRAFPWSSDVQIDPPPAPWDDHEDEIIRERIDKDEAEDIAVYLGRETMEVVARAFELGLTNRKWSDEEDRRLTRAWRLVSIAAIAKRLGRTTAAVRGRATKLGLDRRQRRGWSPNDDAFMRINAGAMSVKAIAKQLNRHTANVSQRMTKLGLRRSGVSRSGRTVI